MMLLNGQANAIKSFENLSLEISNCNFNKKLSNFLENKYEIKLTATRNDSTVLTVIKPSLISGREMDGKTQRAILLWCFGYNIVPNILLKVDDGDFISFLQLIDQGDATLLDVNSLFFLN